jgi:acetolactate synthase-1/2/3 large subunit
MPILAGADVLVRRLKAHGVRHVFGYPGGQLTPLYDAICRDGSIRHVLARDEQAAGFMADGYARATGRPGVFLAVCGPGVYNAATPLATAFTDSIPVLLISGQIPTSGRGLRSGYYHENEQLDACRTFTKRAASLRAESIAEQVDEAFHSLASGRPGPVLLEFPLDVQRAEAKTIAASPIPESTESLTPSAEEVKKLLRVISEWKRPLLLAGGGVIASGAEAVFTRLVDRLGAPTFHTLMGKCALSSEHPLKMGLPWRRATSDVTSMDSFLSPLFREADGVLAIGCRFTQATTGSWALKLPQLAQIDIDLEEIGRHYPASGICADARQTLEALLSALPTKPRIPWTLPQPPPEPWGLPGIDLVGPMRKALPRNAIVVADITRLSYILLAEFPVYEPRTFLHPAGFVSMGFGIPAALGAKTAFPERVVVAVVGDGCFMMSGMELATAVQEKLPIIVVLVNDGSLTLIKAIQERRYQGRYLGVDLQNPDFQLFARAFGVRSWSVTDDIRFAHALSAAIDANEPALIEVRLPSTH